MHRSTPVLLGLLLAHMAFSQAPSAARPSAGQTGAPVTGERRGVSQPVRGAGQEQEILVATYSIVACDLEAKEWGVGVSSRVKGVGNIVPWAKANVGAVATQAQTNRSYGPDGLALLTKGKTAEEVVQELTKADENAEVRQLGVVDGKGLAAAFTGKNCGKFAGHKIGKNYTCQGNILAGEAVVNDMAKAFEDAKGPLAWRLEAALEAAEKAGGDKRVKNKFNSAALLVVRENAGTLGKDDRLIDLRVDDHKEPLAELARLLQEKIKKPGPKDDKRAP
jgi:uncharacterized Ntn-hydrolase superfamily protein